MENGTPEIKKIDWMQKIAAIQERAAKMDELQETERKLIEQMKKEQDQTALLEIMEKIDNVSTQMVNLLSE
jgi:uncharacterized protein YPO0396